MRDKTRTNGKAGCSRSNRESSDRTSGAAGRKASGRDKPQHTARERERMEMGLRILARIIARAHLRRQASGTGPEPPLDQEAGK